MKAALWLSGALAVGLAFAWPFLAPDPESATYRVLALAALWGFLGAIALLVTRKALRRHRRGEG